MIRPAPTPGSRREAQLGPPGAPLRVALDATPLLGRPTGVGVFCAGLLGALAGRSDVAVSAFAVSWRRRGALVGELPSGVSAEQRPMPARPLRAAWRRGRRPALEWFVGKVDVVHGTNFVVPPARRAAQVVTVHDVTFLRFPEMCDPATLAYPALIRRAIGQGAWVHTDSQFVAEEVRTAFPVDPERVRVVHLGTPVLGGAGRANGPPAGAGANGPLAGALGDLVSGGGRRYVLAVGTAEPRKDLPGLVAAFDAVAGDHPELSLVLVGPEGWGEEALRGAIGAARAKERIVRTGWLAEETLGEVVRHAAVLAYPSVYEGFGFPPLQAMAEGVPVVASAAGSLPEILGDGALLVPARDVEALSGALERVLGDEGLAGALATRGRARAARFTWERCVEEMVGLYGDARSACGARG